MKRRQARCLFSSLIPHPSSLQPGGISTMRRGILALLVLSCGALVLAQAPAEFKGHTGLVYSGAFSPDGKVLATGSFDNTVKLWDFATGKELHTLKGHMNQVYCVAFS